MKKVWSYLAIVMLLLSMLVACQKPEPTAPAAPAAAESALQVTGKVDSEMSWSIDDLKAMESKDVESTTKSGETVNNTGVSIMALLDKAGLKGDAAGVAFVADDGYSAQVSLEEVKGCADAIVAIQDDGSLGIIMPDFSSKVQVKGVVEIQVQ